MEFPLTVRMPYGGGVRAPELHDDSPETYYVHTPGVKVAIPSTPSDAKGLLAAAIRDPDPVVVLEPKLHYRTMRGEVPEGEHVVPLGQARLAREGDDVTLVAYGSMVPLAEEAADALAGRRASRCWTSGRSSRSTRRRCSAAAKTGRVVIVQEAPRTAGYAAELAAILAEKAMLDLRGPVLRVTGYDVPYPYWQIEDPYMPSVERVRGRGRTQLARVLVALHELPLEPRMLHGHFSPDLEPALEVEPGDSVASRRRPRLGRRQAGEKFEPRRRRSTPGTRSPGRSRCAARSRTVRRWSCASTRTSAAAGAVTHGGLDHGDHWELRRRLEPRARDREVDGRAVPGRDGHAAARAGVHATFPPRRWGGNIDCKELVAGTTLFLPIPVDGALFSAGDGHARRATARSRARRSRPRRRRS